MRKRSRSGMSYSLIARWIASPLFRPVTVKGRRSAFRFNMNTPQRGVMASLGFFMAPKIGGTGREIRASFAAGREA